MVLQAFSADFMGLLTPVPSGCLFTANSCPFPVSVLQIPFSSTQPPSQQETCNSGWNAQCCGVDHACSSYFVLPSTDHLLHSPLIPQSSFSVPADFPTVRKFFCMRGLPLTFSLLPELLVPFLIPLFFFSSFSHPTWL